MHHAIDQTIMPITHMCISEVMIVIIFNFSYKDIYILNKTL